MTIEWEYKPKNNKNMDIKIYFGCIHLFFLLLNSPFVSNARRSENLATDGGIQQTNINAFIVLILINAQYLIHQFWKTEQNLGGN